VSRASSAVPHASSQVAQRRDHGGVPRDAPDDQDAAEPALAPLQQRDHLVRHAVVQRVQDVLATCLPAVELVGDVRLAVHRAAGRKRNDPSPERTRDRVVDIEPHAPDLLHEELAAAGGALVVREHVRDPAIGQEIDEE
jgi:hypothetical protein